MHPRSMPSDEHQARKADFPSLADWGRGSAGIDPLGSLTAPGRGDIDQAVDQLEYCGTMQQLRLVEAQAAREYFTALAQMPTRFTRADQQRVPDHWHTFGGRSSPLTSSNRLAANPANAILNYLFALIEAEASLACYAVGLDPGLGLLHADQKARDSLALDVMEPVRPEAERYLLDLLAGITFRGRDFHETRTGNCRVHPPLTHRLTKTVLTWTTLLAPVAEGVARRLATAGQIKELPTPLTQANRRGGRAALGQTTRKPRVWPPQLRTCKTCGPQITSPERVYCDAATAT